MRVRFCPRGGLTVVAHSCYAMNGLMMERGQTMRKPGLVLGAFLCVGLLLAGCDKRSAAGGAAAAKGSALVAELTDATFGAQSAQGVMLVDFWAPWCGPCRTQGPIVETVAARVGNAARVVKVNVDHAPQTAQQYGVRSIPTLILLKNGKPVKQFVGVTQADELVAAVNAAQ